MNNVKKCKKCKEIKHTSQFYIDNEMKSGFRSYCKQCVKKQTQLTRLNRVENSKNDINIDNFYKIGKPLKIPKGGFKTTKQIIRFSRFFENV